MTNNNTAGQVGFGTQIRKSPYFDSTEKWGAKGYSVYNHMYIPRSFGDPEQNFWNLVNDAILCDVAVERQVEITGPDAARFVQYLTPRNLSNCQVGQCKYVFITDNDGGIINDPVLLKLSDNHFWLSLADSDVLLWAKGVQIHSGMEVTITEPDVSPLQLQGPKSQDIMRALFGNWIDDLKYYWFQECELDGIPLIVSRTGWSSELGYEIFLRDSRRGNDLWELLMATGAPMGLHPGHTSTIRRIEGGMLSYVADLTIENNPFEVGLERLVDLQMDAEFVGKKALQKIYDSGVTQKQVGIEIFGPPLENPNGEFWHLTHNGQTAGKITSAVYSPRLEKNIALGMVNIDCSDLDTILDLNVQGHSRSVKITAKPFYDPKKKITAKSNKVNQ